MFARTIFFTCSAIFLSATSCYSAEGTSVERILLFITTKKDVQFCDSPGSIKKKCDTVLETAYESGTPYVAISSEEDPHRDKDWQKDWQTIKLETGRWAYVKRNDGRLDVITMQPLNLTFVVPSIFGLGLIGGALLSWFYNRRVHTELENHIISLERRRETAEERAEREAKEREHDVVVLTHPYVEVVDGYLSKRTVIGRKQFARLRNGTMFQGAVFEDYKEKKVDKETINKMLDKSLELCKLTAQELSGVGFVVRAVEYVGITAKKLGRSS